MRGSQHVLISLFSAGILLAPLVPILGIELTCIALLGVFVGALAPDADATDAAIFHREIHGLKGVHGHIINTAAVVLPVFGYTIRYLIYYPLSLFFLAAFGKRYRHQHRGLLHSLIGIAMTTFVLLAYISAIFLWHGWEPMPRIPLFGIAFFAGCFFHLMEDTCTPSGVAWLYPFSRVRTCGMIRTASMLEIRPGAFALVLGLIGVATAAAAFFELVPIRELAVISVGALILPWLLFLTASRVRHGRALRAA
ncbi:hypothetical protein ABH15_06525 [Methanoculleus taiwanensis]|uniref:Metal-dependent hydrolase n=1 Tax=Methanoculleus taiwanensis TaxID=1550565 RepID=A0A498GYX9_9EURY|nr:metal-dependent hydrolase [Methanoculleus taiwanensis]RXE55869.1 hypothetical protein ABH15_06525 [Methanoculleus taiwanensis]